MSRGRNEDRHEAIYWLPWQGLIPRTNAEMTTSPCFTPRLLWAQDKTSIFLTIEAEDIKNENVEVDGTHFLFNGQSGKGNVSIDIHLFSQVASAPKKLSVSDRNAFIVLEKEAKDAPFWPRLVSAAQKLHFVHTDFARWQDEDELQSKEKFDFGNLDMGQYNDYGEPDDTVRLPFIFRTSLFSRARVTASRKCYAKGLQTKGSIINHL